MEDSRSVSQSVDDSAARRKFEAEQTKVEDAAARREAAASPSDEADEAAFEAALGF